VLNGGEVASAIGDAAAAVGTAARRRGGGAKPKRRGTAAGAVEDDDEDGGGAVDEQGAALARKVYAEDDPSGVNADAAADGDADAAGQHDTAAAAPAPGAASASVATAATMPSVSLTGLLVGQWEAHAALHGVDVSRPDFLGGLPSAVERAAVSQPGGGARSGRAVPAYVAASDGAGAATAMEDDIEDY
jgi:hypothetical protein